MTTITTLPDAPSRSDPSTFSTKSDALLGALATFVSETNTVVSEVNALAVSMGSLASGAATSIPYTFSTTTTDADPGAGILRLDNATQNAATTIRVDLVGSDGSTWTDLLATFDDSTSTIKGFIMLQKATDATKWLLFSVSALASPSGYKNITVANVASSAASPFANADALLLKFQRNGDKGETGATGATGPAGADGTDGVSSGAGQVVTATTATTLTSTGTLLKITPASYGVSVTLPDATTCSVGGPLHIIDNKGAYPVRVLNSAGTLLGFIFAGVVSHVSLVDNSSAAGTWTIENSELVGASAQLLTTNMRGVYGCISIDANREFLLGFGASNYTYAVVYDKSTNTFGTPTLIRSADCTAGNVSCGNIVLSATNQVLHVSCTTSSTAFEAVTLSISGTTITVNTAATATLSANISSFADGCGLIAVGSSFVTSYTVATPAAQIRALSISGTTVTIGSASVLDGTAGGLIALGDSTHVIAVSTATTHMYTKPYLVSGSTLTAGTGTDTNSGTMTLDKLASLGTRWYVGYNDGGTTVKGGVVSLNATGNGTTTISTATLFSAGTLQDAIVVGSTKVLALNNQTTNNANILTDTAGTASAGTAITLSSQTTRACLYASGTDVAVQEGTTTYIAHIVDCSGSSPVLKRTIAGNTANGMSNVQFPRFFASNSVLSKDPYAVRGSDFASTLSETGGVSTIVSQAIVKGGVFSTKPIVSYSHVGRSYHRGVSESQVWATDASSTITKVECVA